MSHFRVLGCGLLGSLVGISRQAVHKQIQADRDGKQGKLKRTIECSLRRQLDKLVTVDRRTPEEAFTVLQEHGRAILSDPALKHSHKVRFVQEAGAELEALLGMDLPELDPSGAIFGSTPEEALEDAWACYLSVTQINYMWWVSDAPEKHTFENWPFGKLSRSEAQRAHSAKKGPMPRKGPQLAG